ncbi:HEAT repeat domain-containing protein [Planctomycetota bacterium]
MDTENVVVETDVIETTDEAKIAKAGLANVSLGLAKGTGKLVGESFKIASRFSKTVKQCGEKIAGVDPHTDTAEDPYAQLAEPTGEDVDDQPQVDFKPSAALDPGAEEATSSRRAMRMLVTKLESDLQAAKAELEEMRSQAEGTNTPLNSQLTALQEEKESLLTDLAQARSKADEMTADKDTLTEEITALQSELDATKDKLQQAQNELATQVRTLQNEKESLIAELEQTKSQAEELTVCENTAGEQVNSLESELAATKMELQKVYDQANHTQDELKLQLDALQTKNESLTSDLEEAQDKLCKIKLLEQQFTETAQSETDNVTPDAEQAETTAEPVVDEITSPIIEDISKNSVEEAEEEIIEKEFESSAAAIIENEPAETEQQLEALAADEVVETEIALAEVTVEDANTAVFDGATEKIIFIKALSDLASRDEMARIDAAKAIGSIRHELSVRTLVTQLKTEVVPQVRSECINALAALNMIEGLPTIENALTDKVALVRLAAVRGVYRLAGAESGPALIKMLSDEDESIRRRAVVCIGWLGKKEFAAELVQLLDDGSLSVRQAAIEAMANLRSKAVVSALIEHLSDPEKTIRKAIITALKTITGKKMSGPFPKDEKATQQLIARWRQWWSEEYPE